MPIAATVLSVTASWHWYRNVNTVNEDLILFSVSDSPALEKLGFFRSQGRSATGEIVGDAQMAGMIS